MEKMLRLPELVLCSAANILARAPKNPLSFQPSSSFLALL
jgi:hypothetical protein